MSPESNNSISGLTPTSVITFAIRRTLPGVLITTSRPEFHGVEIEGADVGAQRGYVLDALFRHHQGCAFSGDLWIILGRYKTSPRSRRDVEDEFGIASADALYDVDIMIEQH